MIRRTHSARETAALGAEIAGRLKPPSVVMLIGDLGTGKTTLAKGIVEGLGAAPADDVLSPTFSLVHEYEGHPKVYHLDLYRLDTVPELETLGLEDIWDQEAIVIIEWGERFESQLPGGRLEIHLEHDADDSRIIHLREGRASSRESQPDGYNSGKP